MFPLCVRDGASTGRSKHEQGHGKKFARHEVWGSSGGPSRFAKAGPDSVAALYFVLHAKGLPGGAPTGSDPQQDARRPCASTSTLPQCYTRAPNWGVALVFMIFWKTHPEDQQIWTCCEHAIYYSRYRGVHQWQWIGVRRAVPHTQPWCYLQG